MTIFDANAGKLLEGCHAVQADLATEQGVDTLYKATKALNRPIDVLCANAGRGLGHAFLDQDWQDIKRVIDTNITGACFLQKFARDMVERRKGRILITGSIAGFIPGAYQAVYNATKAFVDSFAYALRHEIADKGVTVTCLMPGATETPFFKKAGMLDTPMGEAKKDDPLDVALTGFAALMNNKGSVIYGIKNTLQVAATRVAPQSWMAEAHRMQAEPSGERRSLRKRPASVPTPQTLRKVARVAEARQAAKATWTLAPRLAPTKCGRMTRAISLPIRIA